MAEQQRDQEPIATDDTGARREYDGIQEYDNPLPRWWVWLFWGTFYFSLAYIVLYWVTPHGKSILEAYHEEAAAAAKVEAERALREAPTEESLAAVMGDTSSVEAGAAQYAEKCAVCHGDRGQGLIGPNLTDAHWLHGKGDLLDIFQAVSEGAVEKGMPAWSKQMAPDDLRRVVAFVGTLRGKNLPGKGPEGSPREP